MTFHADMSGLDSGRFYARFSLETSFWSVSPSSIIISRSSAEANAMCGETDDRVNVKCKYTLPIIVTHHACCNSPRKLMVIQEIPQ